MSRAKAWFLGGGPGASDLLTVRAARVIGAADVVIWGARLIDEAAITEHAGPGAELIPWPPATMDELLGAYDRAVREELVVARLVGGDPAIFVKLDDELERVRELGLAHEIVPGVGALSAAAAALGRQLVTAGSDDSLLIASARSGLQERDRIAVYKAGESGGELQQKLLADGFSAGARCAVAHRLTWPDEVFFTCTLGELGQRLSTPELDRSTLVLVGM